MTDLLKRARKEYGFVPGSERERAFIDYRVTQNRLHDWGDSFAEWLKSRGIDWEKLI